MKNPCPQCKKPLIQIRKHGNVVVHDDGSFCEKAVLFVAPVWPPEKVLAFLMTSRQDIERDAGRSTRGASKQRTKQFSRRNP